MSTEREQVMELIRSLPDDSTIDDIMDELYFRLQVDKGIAELDNGKGIPHKEVEKRLFKWLQK